MFWNQIHHDLARRKKILVRGYINMDLKARVQEDVLYAAMQDTDPIQIIIDCHGGDIVPALNIFDFLSNISVETVGIVCGLCDSAAVTILQGCKIRMATKNSSLYMHYVTTGFDIRPVRESLKLFREKRKLNATLENQVRETISHRTGLPVAKIAELEKIGYEYGARIVLKEALKLNLIDRIYDGPALF